MSFKFDEEKEKIIMKHMDFFCGDYINFMYELEKIESMGFSFVFPGMGFDLAFNVRKRFIFNPRVLIVVGDVNFLIDDNILVVCNFRDAVKSLRSGSRVCYIADDIISNIIKNPEIVDGLFSGNLSVVSNKWRAHASIIDDKSEKVSISGSRDLRGANFDSKSVVRDLCNNGVKILIGDSNKGVDSDVSSILIGAEYNNVEVYTVEDTPRIDVGEFWVVKKIKSEEKAGQKRQMAKDRAMIADSDKGICIFNPTKKNRYGALQISSGTMRNAVQLLREGKKVKFYYYIEGGFKCRVLIGLQDLESLLGEYYSDRLTSDEVRDLASVRGMGADMDLVKFRAEKIIAKYKELVKEHKTEPIPSQMSLF